MKKGSEADSDGSGKLIAAVQQIFSSLTLSPNDTEEMKDILTRFDHRLSDIFPIPDANIPYAAEETSLTTIEEHLSLGNDPSKVFSWDDASFLQAVDDVISLRDSAASADVRCRADVLLQAAMCRIEDEFCNLMTRNAAQLDDLLSINDGPNNIISPVTLADIKKIADLMISSGYTNELCQVYCTSRRQTLMGYISRLGVVKFTIDAMRKMDKTVLDEKVEKWASAMKVMYNGLLELERELCDHVFSSAAKELRDECFLECTRGLTKQLISFGESIGISQPSLEEPHRILQICHSLNKLKPKLHLLFPEEPRKLILDELDEVLKNLHKLVLHSLSEFGNSIQSESSRRPLPYGGLHPMTDYAMNYVGSLVDHHSLLDTILAESSEIDGYNLQGAGTLTPYALHLKNLFLRLDSIIDQDSKLYQNEALRHVFLMNNTHYISKKVKESPIMDLLGDRWVRKLQGRVRQYSLNYLRASWTTALSYLTGCELECSTSTDDFLLHSFTKSRFKSFNLAFEEIHRTQTAWLVPDKKLRDELRVSIAERVLPAYRTFWGKHAGQLGRERKSHKYLKFTPEEIENKLSQFFEGPIEMSNHPTVTLSHAYTYPYIHPYQYPLLL